MSKAQTDLTPLARLQAKWRAARMPTLAAAADALQPHIEAAKVRQQVHEELLAKNVALREENERLKARLTAETRGRVLAEDHQIRAYRLRDESEAKLSALRTSHAERVTAERDDMVEALKPACDRTWGDEPPVVVATVAANGLYWRDRNVATLTARVTALEQALDSLVSAVVRDDNPRDQGHFSGSDEMLYALSVLVATPAQPKCIDHPNPIIREMARYAEGK